METFQWKCVIQCELHPYFKEKRIHTYYDHHGFRSFANFLHAKNVLGNCPPKGSHPKSTKNIIHITVFQGSFKKSIGQKSVWKSEIADKADQSQASLTLWNSFVSNPHIAWQLIFINEGCHWLIWIVLCSRHYLHNIWISKNYWS